MNLNMKRASVLEQAHKIVDRAKAADRELSDSEQSQVDQYIDEVKGIDKRLRKAVDDQRLVERLAGTPRPDVDEESGHAPSLDAADGVSVFQLKDAGERIARRLMSADGPGGVKAVPTSVAQTVPVMVDPEPIGQGGRVDSLFDLFPSRPTDQPSWLYRRQVSRELNASIVGTGEVKPDSVIEFEEVTGRLSVVATVAGPLSESTLTDYPALVRFVQGELLLGIRLAVEDQIISGTGEPIYASDDGSREVGQNFLGILNTPGVLDQAFTGDALGTIATATTRLEADGFGVAGLAVNPSDWVSMVTARNASGGFDLGGAVDAAARTVWGHRVRLSRAVPEGTALAVASESAAIRTGAEGMDVRAIAINDDMARNQVRIRTEGRFALDVYRPGGFAVVHLTDPAA